MNTIHLKGDPTQLESVNRSGLNWYERTRIPVVVYWDKEHQEYALALAVLAEDKEVVVTIPSLPPNGNGVKP